MIDVLIVDDERLIRDGFRRLLELSPGLRVVGEAANGEEALAFLERTHVSVMLLDVRMPRVDGLAVLDALKPRSERPACLVLTTFDDSELLLAAARRGAQGFLSKDVSLEELVSAIKALAAGASWFQPTLDRKPASCGRLPAQRRIERPHAAPHRSRDRSAAADGRWAVESADRRRASDRRRHGEESGLQHPVEGRRAGPDAGSAGGDRSRLDLTGAGPMPACDKDVRHRPIPTGIIHRVLSGSTPLTGSLSRRHWLQAAGASALLMGCSVAFAAQNDAKERLEAIRKRHRRSGGRSRARHAHRSAHPLR